MTRHFPPIRLAFVWGLLLTLFLRHLATPMNPFVTLLLHGLALVAVCVQLALLRRKGWLYLAFFLGSLLLFVILLGMLDGWLISPPRRYYSL